ncbi:uncharacterized protein L201_006024 [Kwoniella dendrophila CBS 6074]|uniref:Uncharacterized protein n=1 Tax=Kwoniella dendrophila CBS 6074 TaxID=1295534 RepID=A0AAX4K1X1_9TREE
MLFQIFLSFLSVNAGVNALPTSIGLRARQAGESHQVNMVNNCGSGEAVFIYEGNSSPQGSTTISGELKGGVAWMSGMTGVECGGNGLNCGTVEFTLTSGGENGEMQNSADYSLLNGLDAKQGTSLGNHNYQYGMDFSFTGACSNGPAACTGNSASECPGAFLGSATEGGAPEQCMGDNVGITITFCPNGPPAAGSGTGYTTTGTANSAVESGSTSPVTTGGASAGTATGTGTGNTAPPENPSVPAGTSGPGQSGSYGKTTASSPSSSYDPIESVPAVADNGYSNSPEEVGNNGGISGASPTTAAVNLSIPTPPAGDNGKNVPANGAGSMADGEQATIQTAPNSPQATGLAVEDTEGDGEGEGEGERKGESTWGGGGGGDW